MTIANKPSDIMSKGAHDALIDQLRACHTSSEILEFENWFNSKVQSAPLYEIICDLLRNRSISRGLGAKWLAILLSSREEKIQSLSK